MIERSSEIFDTFNARFIESERVGSTFVLSPFFDRVCGSENTAILGPRGSGKTTLLKMLTLPALNRWKEKSAGFDRINYLSVYIPASITWSADYRTFSHQSLSPRVADLISMSLFRHSVLLAQLSALIAACDGSIANDPLLSRFHLPTTEDRLPKLTRHLAEIWELKLLTSSFSGIGEAIRARVRLLQRLAVRSSLQTTDTTKLLDEYPFLGSHFVDDASSFIAFLHDEFGFRHKLALCFDELEIASAPVADAVLRAPRSVDQRVLVKFSAAPYVGRSNRAPDPLVPTQQNDFELVFLSSFSAKETREFSEALLASLCSKHEVAGSPQRVLGRSFLDESVVRRSNDGARLPSSFGLYSSHGSYQRKFQNLAAHDSTFFAYALRKGIDVNDLSLGSENSRAAAVRKVLWPVLVREEFLFSQESTSGQTRRLRSKNTVSDIYTGAGALFAICEGNPRWLLGLLEPMVEAYANDALAGEARPARRSLQRRLVERMTAAYFALLSTIPNTSEEQGIDSLVDLVDKIGNYFQRSVLGLEFNPDPVMAFTVDAKTPPKLRDLVGRGLNIAAFVSTHDVGQDKGYRVGDIAGLKVRLANIFAHRYKLPLVGGRTVNLSTIIFRGGQTDTSSLVDLFGVKI